MLCVLVLGWLLQPNLQFAPTGNAEQVRFARTFWKHKPALNVIGQLVLLFVAALGVRLPLGQPARTPNESQTEVRREAPQ